MEMLVKLTPVVGLNAADTVRKHKFKFLEKVPRVRAPCSGIASGKAVSAEGVNRCNDVAFDARDEFDDGIQFHKFSWRCCPKSMRKPLFLESFELFYSAIVVNSPVPIDNISVFDNPSDR